MRVQATVESITNAGVEISFRVHGFPVALQVTRIIMESASAKKLKVRPPEEFREAIPDGGYASLEEFQGDYLADEPDASVDQIQKAFAAEQRRLKKENRDWCVFIGRLKLKWFGSTRLFIPLDVNQMGTIDFVFGYSFRQSGLWYWPTVESAAGATLTLPNKSLKPTNPAHGDR